MHAKPLVPHRNQGWVCNIPTKDSAMGGDNGDIKKNLLDLSLLLEGGCGMYRARTAQRVDKVVTTTKINWTYRVRCQRGGKEKWDITATVGQLDMRWRTSTRTRQCLLVI
jgi:hypothetical protein